MMEPPLRVLIVEDLESDAELLIHEMRRGGFELQYTIVSTSQSFQEAVQAQTWDLILSDASLPEFSGKEALEILGRTELDIPFILVTGTIGEEYAVEMMRAGAHDFVLKGRWMRLVPAVVRELREARSRHERRQAEDRVKVQMRRMASLRAIDMAITSSLDLRVTLNVILDQVTTQLGVDAANVLTFNIHTQTLDHGASRGFHTDALRFTHLHMGEGFAGKAALERMKIHYADLDQARGEFDRSPLFPDEGIVGYAAVPLITKGHVKGVLEVFHRARLSPDQDWFDFLEMLAGQAAIAIENAGLLDELYKSNAELSLSYDATLEGWVKALDLRDKETEGHTKRVTEISVRLARSMGVADAELLDIRRGALLHDIGKLGIPDSILLKPGPLTDDERKAMEMHTVYAHEWLAPIPHLRHSIEIPWNHHERWDGTGYPRGLKGDAIPFSARIFAVVDVWDALRSDRPYRKGWPEEKALEYIQSNSGTHFDPAAVEAFLRLNIQVVARD